MEWSCQTHKNAHKLLQLVFFLFGICEVIWSSYGHTYRYTGENGGKRRGKTSHRAINLSNYNSHNRGGHSLICIRFIIRKQCWVEAEQSWVRLVAQYLQSPKKAKLPFEILMLFVIGNTSALSNPRSCRLMIVSWGTVRSLLLSPEKASSIFTKLSHTNSWVLE